MAGIDEAGRAIAGLLTYNPGPGIYSRLERAIEAMPDNVRVQELPGLLKRYKEGVPGWELKATDLESTIGDRLVVPKAELLAAVKERSPVYTHREIVLGGTPQTESRWAMVGSDLPVEFRGTDEEKIAAGFVRRQSPIYQRESSPLGSGVSHGGAKYEGYGQGGKDYAELLLTQRPRLNSEYGNHWDGIDSPSSAVRVAAEDGAVAHARFDTHGDALRINELQSDLGIHNRKMREQGGSQMTYNAPPQLPTESDVDYALRLTEEGYEVQWLDDGNLAVGGRAQTRELPFPLEDSWSDLLIKRLALEAARKGHRAIEVASPRAIADKVGGNIENYEHFYGKVIPGAIERLGRKMGGLTPDDRNVAPAIAAAESPQYETHQQLRDHFKEATGDGQPGPNFWRLYSGMRYDSLPPSEQAFTYDRFGGSHPVSQVDGGLPQEMYDYLHSLGLPPEKAQSITSQAMYLAPHNARAMHNFARREQLDSLGGLTRQHVGEAGRRYIMSDEMRRRLIEQGVGASVLAPLLATGEE